MRRTVYPTVPAQVDYRLTELGTSLTHLLGALADWSLTHREDIAQAQADYDRAHPGRPVRERPASVGGSSPRPPGSCTAGGRSTLAGAGKPPRGEASPRKGAEPTDTYRRILFSRPLRPPHPREEPGRNPSSEGWRARRHEIVPTALTLTHRRLLASSHEHRAAPAGSGSMMSAGSSAPPPRPLLGRTLLFGGQENPNHHAPREEPTP